MKILTVLLIITATALSHAEVPPSAAPTSPSAAPASQSAAPSSPSATPVSPSKSASPSAGPSKSASPSASPSKSASPSVSPSKSASPSVSPSKSVAPSSSVRPSKSASPSSSASISASISPSASSPMLPTSSKVPTAPPTTTTPKPKYAIDAVFKDEKTEMPCVWFEANIDVMYKYKNDKNQTKLTLDKDFKVTEGSCSNFTDVNDTSLIVMKWTNHSLTVQFKVTKDKSWTFHKIGVSLNVPAVNLVDQAITAMKTFTDSENSQYLHAEPNSAYSCETQEQVFLTSDNPQNYNISIIFNSIMVQPFSNNGTQTKDVNGCSSKSEPSSSSSIVPIAVGCALAGLIVIVLIAYLIGRRKNDGRGYQQV